MTASPSAPRRGAAAEPALPGAGGGDGGGPAEGLPPVPEPRKASGRVSLPADPAAGLAVLSLAATAGREREKSDTETGVLGGSLSRARCVGALFSDSLVYSGHLLLGSLWECPFYIAFSSFPPVPFLFGLSSPCVRFTSGAAMCLAVQFGSPAPSLPCAQGV